MGVFLSVKNMLDESKIGWKPVQPVFFLTVLQQHMASTEENGKRSEVAISALKGKFDVGNDKLTTQEMFSREQRLSNQASLDSNLQKRCVRLGLE